MTSADIARVDGISPEVAVHFRDELRAARARALQDAESFQAVVQVVERLGEYLNGNRARGLWGYRQFLEHLASKSVLGKQTPATHPHLHPAFLDLLWNVADARNSAIHEGTYARTLTAHAVEFALILEHALMSSRTRVRDFMVQGVVTAAPWQPLSLVRRTLLANSYSYLPIDIGRGQWRLVSDYSLARYLLSDTNAKARLNQTMEQASIQGLVLDEPLVCGGDIPVTDVLAQCRGLPVLIVAGDESHLIGIATPFDLL
jgi:hypothetical protein